MSKQETSIDGGSAGGGFVLGDYENNSLENKREGNDRISGLLDRILDAVQILGEEGLPSPAEQSENAKINQLASKLRVRVSDMRQKRDALFQRRVDNLANTSAGRNGASKNDIDSYISSSIDGGDDNQNKDEGPSKEEKMLKRLIETPTWLPPQLAAFAATSPVEVSVSHWKMIKTDLLADSGFICTSWDSTDVAAVYRGRLPRAPANSRTSETEDDEEQYDNSITAVFEELQDRLDKHDELKQRVRLFLVDDNEWLPTNYGREEEEGPPPVIVALAKEVQPEQETERGLGKKSLAAFSTLLTTFTTFAYALSTYALNPTFYNSIVKDGDISAVPLSLPIFLGVLAVSALHEAAHIVASQKHSVRLGLPVPLPSLQVGTFGTITPLRSFPSTRTALFDVALSGPGVSMLVSLILIVSGLSLTITSQSLPAYPFVPAAMMKSSFLIGSIVSVVAPKMMLVPLSQPVPIHPFFLVGFAGLLMTAVNLLPIGVSSVCMLPFECDCYNEENS